MENYEWYTQVDPEESLEQGDILRSCQIIIPNKSHYDALVNNHQAVDEMEILTINAIVLSQSCDIVNVKIDSIIVCPIWPHKSLLDQDSYYRSSAGKEDLRQGKSPSYHLLNKFPLEKGQNDDYYFVNFHNIYSVPKNYISYLVGSAPRTRLLPPYREHLSQSFARYFMRVGLPTDIPRDEIKNYKLAQ